VLSVENDEYTAGGDAVLDHRRDLVSEALLQLRS
jgi:hypothetical protein